MYLKICGGHDPENIKEYVGRGKCNIDTYLRLNVSQTKSRLEERLHRSHTAKTQFRWALNDFVSENKISLDQFSFSMATSIIGLCHLLET